MILRGIKIQRDGHGKCGLLPNRTLSSHRAELPSSGVFAPACAWMNPATWFSLIVAPNRERLNVSDSKNRKPLHVTRARCRGVRVPPA